MIITIDSTTINAEHVIALRDEGSCRDKRLVALYTAFGSRLQILASPEDLDRLRAAMCGLTLEEAATEESEAL